jgi:glutamyl-tRNA synthetase
LKEKKWTSEHIKKAIEVLEKITDWRKESLDEGLMTTVTENGYKTGEFFMNLRIAITGSKFTPPINDSILILGKEETISRLKALI